MGGCKIGFVGAGGVALRHARHMAAFPDVAITSVTDHTIPPLRHSRRKPARPRCQDVDALLAASPDAIYVCVPPHAHGAIEAAVLGAGIALFVEKPIGIDVPTARDVARLARERDVVTAVGHHWRYSESVRQVRDMLGERPIRLAVVHGSTRFRRRRGGPSEHCRVDRSSNRPYTCST